MGDFDFGGFLRAEAYGRKVIDIHADGPSAGCQGVTVYLDGTDGAGNPVYLDTVTDADGYLEFTDLWPGGSSQVPESVKNPPPNTTRVE